MMGPIIKLMNTSTSYAILMAGPLSIDQFRQFNVHCLQSGILIESCQGIITCLKKKLHEFTAALPMFAHGKCPKRGVVWMTPWLWDAKLIYFQVSIRKYPSKHLQIPMEKPWKTYFLPVPHHIVEAPVQCCRPRPLPEQLQRDCFFLFSGGRRGKQIQPSGQKSSRRII